VLLAVVTLDAVGALTKAALPVVVLVAVWGADVFVEFCFRLDETETDATTAGPACVADTGSEFFLLLVELEPAAINALLLVLLLADEEAAGDGLTVLLAVLSSVVAGTVFVTGFLSSVATSLATKTVLKGLRSSSVLVALVAVVPATGVEAAGLALSAT
jgi:hypothetical protein